MPCLLKTILLGLGLSATFVLGAPTPSQLEFFEKNIRPVLAEHCYECHNSGGKAKGDLALDWRGGWMDCGDNGPLFTSGKPEGSLLLRVLRHQVKDLKMPKDGPKFSPAVVKNFERWIAMGAPDPRLKPPTKEQIAKATSWETIREQRKKWWSFQPIHDAKPPKVKGNWTATDIDKFIQAKWSQHNLKPAPDAKPEVLIRRLSFALTGLPPTPEETLAFTKAAAVNRQSSIVNAIDRLLASPHFGERWARHWMDWVRYAESLGSEGDPRIPHAAQYRNYLIRALNADVPYDQLLREHIAGDLLPKPRVNAKLGLNESAIGPAHYRFVLQGFAPTDALDELVRTTEDQIDVISKAFLGLTVSCARCHNHKFDAISQKDYHAFYSIMTSTRPATINVDSPARQTTNKAAMAKTKTQIRAALAKLWLTAADKFAQRLLKPDGQLQNAINGAKNSAHPLHAWQRLQKVEGDAFVKIWAQLDTDFRNSFARLEAQRKRPYAQDWQFRKGDAHGWVQNGNGLNGTAAPAGAFRVLPKGERIAEDILPAGVYSHLLSDKHTGMLGTPRFRIGPNETLWVRVRGSGGVMARYVVQNYTRNGTVYPATRLNDGKWRWQKWSLKYWEGDDAHFEISTAGEQAVLAAGNVNSWFGVTGALVQKPGQPAPRDEAASEVAPLFDLGKPDSREVLAKQYTAALRNSLEAWQRDAMTDAQANFLGYFVRTNLLPNTLASTPKAAQLVENYRKLEAAVTVPQRAPGVVEGDARDMPLFARGSHKQPGEPVSRRFLEAFDAKPFDTKQSGRLELAEAMLRPDNPLVARVIVNRVWHHLFGRGLVGTPDNFGKLGELPTHPELLDYLATRFVREGWSFKKLIRELALTRTFQLSAISTSAMRAIDPDNHVLARAHLRRLEAEAIRDAMLQASGSLDRNPLGGSDAFNTNRRSIYVRVIRNNLDPFLSVFDMPVPATAKGRRDETNVPAQSLTLMNDPFVISLADRLANRVRNDKTLATPEAQIRSLFQLTLNRDPSGQEITAAKTFLKSDGGRQLEAQEKMKDVRERLNAANSNIAAIRKPVRKRLLSARKKENEKPKATGPKPFAAWNFSKGTEDQIGKLDLSLQGGAKVENGALVLNGRSAFARSVPLTKAFRVKTLEAWVQLNTLNQRGGGVMSLQTRNGVIFDAIVFGEQQAGHWMAGSNSFKRTLSMNGPAEKEAAQRPVHVAIVYNSDGTIIGYRDGKPYGRSYKMGLQPFSAGDTEVIFGLRHGTGAGNSRMLAGKVLKAHLYDRALEASEILASAGGNPNYISEKEMLAAMTDSQRKQLKGLNTSLEKLNAEMSALQKIGAVSPDPWRDFAQAMFNLKEFIYIQ